MRTADAMVCEVCGKNPLATVGLLCPRGSVMSADFLWVFALSAVLTVRGFGREKERKREE
jgi:hypothetical protein